MDCGAGGCVDLVAEREVDANGSEIRELHAQLFGSHAVATLLLAQEISCPFGADRGEFHVGASAPGAGGSCHPRRHNRSLNDDRIRRRHHHRRHRRGACPGLR